jgi:hypothetical protein
VRSGCWCHPPGRRRWVASLPATALLAWT